MEENQNKGCARGCLVFGLAAVALVALVIFLLSVSGGKDTPKPAATSAPTSSAASSSQTAGASKSEKDLEKCLAQIKDVLKDSDGNYEVAQEDGSIVLRTWRDGLVSEVYGAASGDAAAVALWNQLVQNYQALAANTQKLVDGYDLDQEVFVQLINDENKELTLMVVSGDSVLYDVVNGIDYINN